MPTAPLPTVGPTPANLWFVPRLSAKHAANNERAERGSARVRNALSVLSTRHVPIDAGRPATAQGFMKWSSSLPAGFVVAGRAPGVFFLVPSWRIPTDEKHFDP